ncbi:hypothetical protein CRE_31181 [Caenorhabditis remanei]|uniref:Uncharacterized protein n=1 Tax=Caenorhabditis remanei TaxID=31234 RepID=E3MLG1_CAERE|nr:hypothetical protein CRE_31181 [Caenorhabditis remanei]
MKVSFFTIALFLLFSTVEARPVVVANLYGNTDAGMIHVPQKRANRLVLDVTLALLLSYFGLTVGGIIFCCCWRKEVVDTYKSLDDGTSTTDPETPIGSFLNSTQVVTTSRFYY